MCYIYYNIMAKQSLVQENHMQNCAMVNPFNKTFHRSFEDSVTYQIYEVQSMDKLCNEISYLERNTLDTI